MVGESNSTMRLEVWTSAVWDDMTATVAALRYATIHKTKLYVKPKCFSSVVSTYFLMPHPATSASEDLVVPCLHLARHNSRSELASECRHLACCSAKIILAYSFFVSLSLSSHLFPYEIVE